MGFKVNGRYFDWGMVDISIDGVSKDITGEIIEISYEEKEELKARYGLGNMPKGYSKGKVEFTGKIVFNKEGFDQFIQKVVKSQGKNRVSEISPVNINIHYMDDEKNRVITDVLEKVKFHSPKNSAKQGDTELTVEMEMLMMNIKRGA